jgi:hypothetical protein
MNRLLLPIHILLVAILLGARTSSADTYPRQGGIDVLHYVFKLDLADDSDLIAGEATIEVRFAADGTTGVEKAALRDQARQAAAICRARPQLLGSHEIAAGTADREQMTLRRCSVPVHRHEVRDAGEPWRRVSLSFGWELLDS